MGGYVDIHCHGGGGHTFGTTVEASLAAAAAHREHGTASVVASLVSAPLPELVRQLEVIRAARAIDSRILGAHLEGPFLAPARKGAHNPEALIDPTPHAVDELIEAGGALLRQITIAPELPGAIEAVERFVAAGVSVAIGHTEATADQAKAAFDAGATLVTHGFNAMRGISAREGGPVGAALADARVSIELIADGIHVDPSLLAALFRAAPGRIVLVTDAMAAAAANDGDYDLGGLAVSVAHGRAVIAGTNTLAGSTLTMERAIEVCVDAGVPRDQAVSAATTQPLTVIGEH